VLAAVLSMAFLGERMTPVQMAGGGLILASVVILQVRRPPEQIPLELSISGE
jgi:drug/metabolite transporter (DMT)-like permease